jgi:putative PIN family toxin of toxin-antitoxin system
MRFVLDTNIIVSAFLVALGAPARIVAAWRAGDFEVVVSRVLLAEYEEVRNYERIRRRHHMTPQQITAEVQDIERFAILVEPEAVPAVIAADPDDDQVLACAAAGQADYIVSGDPHLLNLREYRGIRILSPAALAALLKTEE